MRGDVTSGQRTLLESGAAVVRWFLSVEVAAVETTRIIVTPAGDRWIDEDGGFVLWREPAAAGPVGFWSGDHPLTVGGRRYRPIEALADIQAIEQTSELSAPGLSLVFPGIRGDDEGVLALVQGSVPWHQKPATVSVGLFSPATRAIEGGLLPMFEGRFDQAKLQQSPAGGPATLQVTLESIAADLGRSFPSYRSDRDQRMRSESDRGLRYSDKTFDLNWNGVKMGRGEESGRKRRRHHERRQQKRRRR